MTNPTAPETTLLQTQPHRTKLWLSIYQPLTTLACRVDDGSISKGARDITYDGVTEGTYLNVKANITMYVGTTLGGNEKGRVRVKSITSSVITVAENSHINWEDNDYLTIVNFFEINPVYPRIIQDTNDPFDLIFYKDYDVAYTNQNDILGSLINMGGNVAGFVNEPVYFTGEGTTNFEGESLDYQWNLGGSDVGSYNGQIPGYVNYSTPGHYLVGLTVSGSTSGTIDESWRHISIYDRPESGSNTPILAWEMNELSGSRGDGGYEATIKVFEDVNDRIIREGSLVVIWQDNWYGGTKQSIGGNDTNRSHVLFTGYILSGSIEFNSRESSIEFNVVSPMKILKESEGFSISIESTEDVNIRVASDENIPDGWVVLKDMTPKKALYHYLKWHTTLLSTQDVRFSGFGFDDPVQFYDSDRESIYDATSALVKNGLLGDVACDRQGALYFEAPIWSQQESGTFNTGYALESKDWMGDPTIEENFLDTVSFIEIGGIAYDGVTSSAYLASMPGDAPGYRGGLERVQGLILRSQDQLNLLGGDLFAYRNRQYESIQLTLVGNFVNFDIAPQEIIPVTIDSNDNNRGISFTQKSFSLLSVTYQYDARSEILLNNLVISEISQGIAGDTIVIPEIPPTEGGDNTGGGGFDIPPIDIPPIPPPPIGGLGVSAAFATSASINATTGVVTWTSQIDPQNLLSSTFTDINLTGSGIYYIYLHGTVTRSSPNSSTAISVSIAQKSGAITNNFYSSIGNIDSSLTGFTSTSLAVLIDLNDGNTIECLVQGLAADGVRSARVTIIKLS